MNEDPKLSEEQARAQERARALRSMRGGAAGEDRGLHGLTSGSLGDGRAALRDLMRGGAGAPSLAGPVDGPGGGREAVGEAAAGTEPAAAAPSATEPSGTDAAAASWSASQPSVPETFVPGTFVSEPFVSESVDEGQALRDLLRGAVVGLEPSGDALERLQSAVPRRQARKRQALVAAVAAVLLVGTAVPAALHMTGAQNATPDHSTMAGHGRQGGGKKDGVSDPHQNGSGTNGPKTTKSASPGQGAGGAGADVPSPLATGLPGGVGEHEGPGVGDGIRPGVSIAGAGLLPPPAAPGVPGCSAEQLGVSGSARPPAADGKVVGSFKVTNVSGRGCTVLGPDKVTAAPAAGQSGSGVAVVGHTTGDPATGLLPDPSAESPLMLLAPNAAYEVAFAWVPAGPCPGASTGTGGQPPQGATSDSPAGGAAQSSAGTAGAGGAQQSGPPTDPAGVAVSHTPTTALPGAATTQTTIPDVCGGTVYRTGVIPLPEPVKP